MIMDEITHKGSIDGYFWRCKNKSCKKNSSDIIIRRRSFLFGCSLPLKKILQLIYYWAIELRKNPLLHLPIFQNLQSITIQLSLDYYVQAILINIQ
jgi:hypothetical protein